MNLGGLTVRGPGGWSTGCGRVALSPGSGSTVAPARGVPHPEVSVPTATRRTEGEALVRRSSDKGRPPGEGAAPPLNWVELRGRLSATPEARALPSGDTVVSLRLVVPRGPGGRRRAGGTRRSATVDTIDCAIWRADVRRRAVRWRPAIRFSSRVRYAGASGGVRVWPEVVTRSRWSALDARTAPESTAALTMSE